MLCNQAALVDCKVFDEVYISLPYITLLTPSLLKCRATAPLFRIVACERSVCNIVLTTALSSNTVTRTRSNRKSRVQLLTSLVFQQLLSILTLHACSRWGERCYLHGINMAVCNAQGLPRTHSAHGNLEIALVAATLISYCCKVLYAVNALCYSYDMMRITH